MLQHFADPIVGAPAARAGFRFGDRGVHTSRTIMLAEIGDLLAVVPPDGVRADYTAAIVDENVLGKATIATRRWTNQRLGELYALDPRVPIFRVLRRLWPVDVPGRPLLAMLCALARDPLLRSTAPAVLALPVGAELVRSSFLDDIRQAVGVRLNEAVLDKVARNAASSWRSPVTCGAACARSAPMLHRHLAAWRWHSGSARSKGWRDKRCSTAAGPAFSTARGRNSCRWRSRRSSSA